MAVCLNATYNLAPWGFTLCETWFSYPKEGFNYCYICAQRAETVAALRSRFSASLLGQKKRKNSFFAASDLKNSWGLLCPTRLTPTSSPYQLLEEVAHTLLVAPVLDPGQQSVIEVLVDLMKLRHFEEDGLYLLDGQHRLGSRGCGPQRLHRLVQTCDS